MNATDKLFAIFGLFTTEEPEWTVEDAANRLGIAVSTTYRHFKSLSDAGLIVAFAAGRYVLGPAIVQLDRQIRLQDPLIKVAAPIMRRLAGETPASGTFLLCRLYRSQVMCVHQEHCGTPSFGSSYERGRLMPLHRGAASKIILASLPARIVRSFHKDHLGEIQAVGLGGDWETLKRKLRALRGAKVCVTYAELDPGAIGIASAIFSPDNTAVGSLALALADKDTTDRILSWAKERVPATATAISTGLSLIASRPKSQTAS